MITHYNYRLSFVYSFSDGECTHGFCDRDIYRSKMMDFESKMMIQKWISGRRYLVNCTTLHYTKLSSAGHFCTHPICYRHLRIISAITLFYIVTRRSFSVHAIDFVSKISNKTQFLLCSSALLYSGKRSAVMPCTFYTLTLRKKMAPFYFISVWRDKSEFYTSVYNFGT